MNGWRWFGKVAAVASAVALTGCYLHYRVTRNSVPFSKDGPFLAPSDAGAKDEGGSTYMYSSKSAPMLPADAVEKVELPPPGATGPQFLPGSKSDILLPPSKSTAILPGSKDMVPVFDADDVFQRKPARPGSQETAPPAQSATQSQPLVFPGSKSLAPVFGPTEISGTKSAAK